MNLFFWLAISFIVGGFIVLLSMKKDMEKRVALASESEESTGDKETSPNPVIWWIVGAVLWSLVSMYLVVQLFSL